MGMDIPCIVILEDVFWGKEDSQRSISVRHWTRTKHMRSKSFRKQTLSRQELVKKYVLYTYDISWPQPHILFSVSLTCLFCFGLLLVASGDQNSPNSET